MKRGFDSDSEEMQRDAGTSTNEEPSSRMTEEGRIDVPEATSHASSLGFGSPSSRSEADSPDRKRSRVVDEENESASPFADSHAFSSLDDVDLATYVREHNATLTFPEKLMLMLMHAERIAASSGKRPDELPISWVNNGLAFVIKNKAELVSGWLPQFFRQAKFSSFTRKLYRWQFRQVNNNAGDPLPLQSQRTSVMYFGNENFQRDNKTLLSNMRSITAAGRRREQAEQAHQSTAESKEQDMYRMTLEPRALLQQSHSQHMPSAAGHQLLGSNASLMQLRNAHAALASLGGMEQQSNPLMHRSNPLIQQAVARAQFQQQQQQQQQHFTIQRLLAMQSQDTSRGGNQYLLQLAQLINQPQAPTFLNRQQYHAFQEPQMQVQPQVLQQDTEQQRQERLRSVYEMLLQQIPMQNQGEPTSFLPRPPQPPPPPPDDC